MIVIITVNCSVREDISHLESLGLLLSAKKLRRIMAMATVSFQF